MDSKHFGAFSSLVHSLTGVTIDPSRSSMLASRVGSRMRQTGVDDHSAYYQLVLNDKQEQQLFIDKVTTHETSFFRTPRIWQYIEEQFLVDWESRNPEKTCNIWSAACASGEEAYSLAIMMSEHSRSNAKFRFSIDASDISEEVVSRAREGQYKQRAIKRFSQDRDEVFSRYITGNEDHYTVSDKLKPLTNYFSHNLFEKAPTNRKYDLVLLRNVLIYFTAEDQNRVLQNIRSAMNDDSTLIIGESESIHKLDCGFYDIQPLIYTNTQAAPLTVAASG